MEDIKGFLTTASEAMEFFDRCIKAEAVTVPELLKIMEQMVKERRVFAQHESQIAKRLNGKKVLVIKHGKRP